MIAAILTFCDQYFSVQIVRDIVSFLPIENIKVCLRCTGYITDHDLQELNGMISEHKFMTLSNGEEFELDAIFPHGTFQDQVYKTSVSPLVREFMNGHNATFFSYGEIRSGKTYTIQGKQVPKQSSHRIKGMLHFAVMEILKESSPSSDFKLEFSKIVLHGDKVHDCLANCYVQPHFNNQGKVCINVRKYSLDHSHAECLRMVTSSYRGCEISALHLRKNGSRSKLMFVDLLASESVAKPIPVIPNMDTSITSLHNVLEALSFGAKRVNYRSSLLTRLVSNSLGGSSRTVYMIHAFSTNTSGHLVEKFLIPLLRFGNLCKSIENDLSQSKMGKKNQEDFLIF